MGGRLVGVVMLLALAACGGSPGEGPSSNVTPTARTGAVFVTDPAHGAILLFGGEANGDVLGDTWLLAGGQWRRVPARPSPPARAFTAATSDGHGGVLLFGGDAGGSSRTDTWRWDGARWSQLHPRTTPDAGTSRLMAGSPPALVVFGADHQVRTWTWTSKDWREAPPGAAPTWRTGASMAGKILFGGVDAQGIAATDTWSWDGTAWSELHPAHRPAAGPGTMAELSTGPLLFEQDGTWTWNGADWTLAQPAGEPPWQQGAALAAVPGAQPGGLLAIVLTGTPGQTGQTWRWNGFGWSAT